VATRTPSQPQPTPTDGASAGPSSETALSLSASNGDLTILTRLVEGTVRSTGAEFFHNLVRNLTLALEATHALVAEFADTRTRVRSLAFWGNGTLLPDVEYDLAGTPCEDVARGQLCRYRSGVQQRFPRDHALVAMRVESYLGVPLLDDANEVLGHLAVFDVAPSRDDERRLAILQIFAARAAAELERLRAEQRLRASEGRFRNLYEEAPIAYVYEDTETRFVSANRAAINLLGLKPEEVVGTVGRDLLAPTELAHQRVDDAFRDLKQGKAHQQIEFELRRKDDGRPVWVQFWSKPDPDGKFTRTMIIDITARVLAEQDRERLQQQNRYLQEEIKSEYNFDEIIGNSPALRATLAKVRQVAPTDSTVLILGETGTGKELVARAIHNISDRRERPLIKVNCAALPTGLIESELFGHEKGAFTGATQKRVGRFALADGGTIFLDEIGELQPEVQIRLLRVLQEHEFEPVGSSKTVKVDVRVIAATNRNLEKAVADGSFRADLFYRLHVFPIHMPPLRERAEDLPMLTHYFMEKHGTRIGRRMDAVEETTMQRLLAYPWPGNVRELENVVERAVILSRGSALEVEAHALRPPITEPARPTSVSAPHPAGEGSESLAALQHRHTLRALEQCGWVIEGPRGAATMLGLHPNTLRSRMKKLGIMRQR
jgi:formate hydrogenlyase transcriptional activator